MKRLLPSTILMLLTIGIHLLMNPLCAQVNYEELRKKPIEEVLSLAMESDDWASTAPIKTSLGTFDPYWKVNELVHVVTHPPTIDDYQLLQNEGVRTIISLDVISPDQEISVQYGISVFHVPMLHGEILPDSFAKILQIMLKNTGPYLIHAGPNEDRAMPVGALAAKWGDSRYQVKPWRPLYLLSVMDFPAYKRPYWNEMIGLLSVFQEKEIDALPENLSAPIEPILLSEEMTVMGQSSDALLESSAHQWQLLPHINDSSLEFEAQKIEEISTRWVSITPNEQMSRQFQETAEFARLLKLALNQEDHSSATAHWNSLIESCQRCHDQFRDQK